MFAQEWRAIASTHGSENGSVKRGLRIRPRPLRLIRTAEDEARHLLELAETGESAETPAIVIGFVALGAAIVVAIVLGAALVAYYVSAG